MGQFNLLEKKLREAAQQYYTDGTSKISDTAFDLAQEAIRKEIPNSDVVKEIGWGYDVLKDSTPGSKVKHRYGVVGSLSKAYNWGEISQGIKNQPVDISLKLDGLSVVLYYTDGLLTSAVTRGDGTTGIDITDKMVKVLHVNEITLKDSSFTGAVRGELLMRTKDWEEFKKLHPEAKNSRNATAGLINAKDVRDDLKYVSCLVYKVVGSKSKPELSMPTMNVWLQQNFCNTTPHVMGSNLSEQDCEKFDELLNILNQNDTLPVDGLVMKHRDIAWDSESGSLTYVEQAFKFPAEVALTKVFDVEWNLTKNRYLVPRINVETVHISGTDVSWCTGYNAKYIQENDIGPDTVVTIEKHGEIIPNINEIIVSTGASIPCTCPVCQSQLEWDGVHLVCKNSECNNAKIQDVLVWTNMLVPMENFGDTLRLKFLKEELGSDLSIESLMDLSQITAPGRVSSVQANLYRDMMVRLISKDKFDLLDVIKALNIPRFADSNARKLYSHIASLKWGGLTYEEIVERILDPNYLDELKHSIGDANANSIVSHPDKLKRLLLVRDRIVDPKEETKSYRLVAVTGKLSVKRSDFESELYEHGFKVSDVSKNTEVLITDDPNSNSSKNQKADKFGIRKMTEAQFREEFMA